MEANTRSKLRSGILGSFVLSLVIAGLQLAGAFERLEEATLDWRYRHFNRPTPVSDRVKVFDVDETSLKALEAAYGRWPWPRSAHKELVEFLAGGAPKGIFFDIEFVESQKGTTDDLHLIQASLAASQAGTLVSHAMALMEPSDDTASKPEALPSDFIQRFSLARAGGPLSANHSLGNFPVPVRHTNFRIPNPNMYPTLPYVHSVNTDPDTDGVFRHVPLLMHYEGAWVPTLSLAAVLSTLEKPAIEYRNHALWIRAENAPAGILKIPVDPKGRLRLHFYSGDLISRMVPIAAALGSHKRITSGEVTDPSQLPVNPLELENQVLLVGASATGLADLKVVPTAAGYPGVLLHATAISNILSQDFLHAAPAWITPVIALILAGATYFFALFFHHVAMKLVLPLLLVATYWALAIWTFKTQSLHLALAAPSAASFAAILHGFAYMSFIEGRDRKRMQGALSKYLSPAVASHLIATGINPQAEVGRNEELSVLFSDIRGFTTLSEKFQPAEVVRVLNRYLGRMTNVIFEKEGTLDKFIGDAIMAFWGAPLTDSEHAVKAVRCALEMRAQLLLLKKEWQNEGQNEISINIGIGINTGPVIVGNIGSEKRLDYTVIGDNVNLASRIEGLTKQYHLDFLIGARTRELVDSQFICREIDWVRAKGKLKPVSLHEPLCASGAPDAARQSRLSALFAAALESYRKGSFDAALGGFQAVLAEFPNDGPSQVFEERCKELSAAPPADWDGVFVAKSK